MSGYHREHEHDGQDHHDDRARRGDQLAADRDTDLEDPRGGNGDSESDGGQDGRDVSRADWAQLHRADVALLQQAAGRLRHAATQHAYRGARHPERAYAIASILDLAAIRWRDQHPALRPVLRRCCRILLDPPTRPPG